MMVVFDEKTNPAGLYHEANDPRAGVPLFSQISHDFSKMLSRRVYPDFILLEMSPTCEIAAVPFIGGGKVFIACIQLLRNAVAEGTQVRERLLAKRDEFGKLLDLFHASESK